MNQTRRYFGDLIVDWDKPELPVPSSEQINDALEFLQSWPEVGTVPDPAGCPGGSIALELYDEDDHILGGVELTDNRNAVFSIFDRTNVLCFDKTDTTSRTSINEALSRFTRYLA